MDGNVLIISDPRAFKRAQALLKTAKIEFDEFPDSFGIVLWNDVDVKKALKDEGHRKPNLELIEKVRQEAEGNMADRMTERGWIVLQDAINGAM